MKIIIVEDDKTVGQYVQHGLEEQHYHADLVDDGLEGLRLISGGKYDLAVLDLRLPGMNGVEMVRTLRDRGVGIPILVLTAQDALESKVAALRAGADDYVTKPFSTAELLARLRAAQRRALPPEDVSVFTLGELTVDLAARRVTKAGVELKLTATEYALLRLFVRHAGRVLTHRHILREVWGPKSEEHRQYLRVYVTHLRQKIEREPTKPVLIRTEPGIGYRFASADGA